MDRLAAQGMTFMNAHCAALQVAGIASTSLIISDAVKEALESAKLKRWRAHPIGA